MDLEVIGREGVNWNHLAQYKDQWGVVVNTVMNVRVLIKAGNFLSSWARISFTRRSLLH